MWVQEGNDCKDSNDVAPSKSSLFSRIYSISKPKQTVTTIAIPMKSTIENKIDNKNNNNKNNNNIDKQNINDIQIDEKEKEPTPISPTQFNVTPTPTPISPAQFLQNMRKKELSNISDDIDDIPMFTTNDIEMEDLDGEYSNDFDAGNGNDMDVDLTIIGKKLSYVSMSDEEKEEKEEKMKEILIEFDETPKENQENQEEKEKEEIEWDYYIPKRFDGLDIERTIEWQQCLDFTQDDNLLIIELYSTVFGASDVMYPFIDEILHKKAKNKKIKFVRLSINKMNEIKEIREIIINNYFPTPIPIYIFIKNGVLSDELYGTKPKEFEQIIDKYVQNNQAIAVQNQTTPAKYTSILMQRPPSSYLSPIGNKNRGNNSIANSTQNVENIKNLIHNLDINQLQCQTTKLSESRSVGTTTQHFV